MFIRVGIVSLDPLMGPRGLANNNKLFMVRFELWLNNGCLWTFLVSLCLWVSGHDLTHKIHTKLMLLDCKW